MRVAKVGLREANMTFDRLYSYSVPLEMDGMLHLGHRVLIPFGKGNRLVEGLVLGLTEEENARLLKPLHQILDPYPVLYPDQIRLASLMVQRYACTWGSVLRLMLPGQMSVQRSQTVHLTEEGEQVARAYEEERSRAVTTSGADVFVTAEEIPDKALAMRPEVLAGLLLHKRNRSLSLKRLYQLYPDASDALTLARKRGWVYCSESLQTQKGKRVRTVSLADDQEASRLLETGDLRSIRQVRTLELLLEYGELPVQDLCAILSAPPGYLRGMIQKGWIRTSFVPEAWLASQNEEETTDLDCVEPQRNLTAEQQQVYQALLETLQQKREPGVLHEHLLHGVTGSGKTEVYLRLTQWALEHQQSVLLLVPEIALTPQMCQQFHQRFGARVSVLHSRLRPSARQRTWDRVRKSEVQIVVGPRSAILAPVRNLALIIVDEEQERSYVSEMHPRYDARTLARLRCKETGAVLLLGSATPSIEAYYRTQTGQSLLHRMRERPGQAVLPEVLLVDMKQELLQGNASILSLPLQEGLASLQERGEQAILLLNRRGYASNYSCSVCGYTVQCPRCSVHMTYHKSGSRLICHACGHTQSSPQICPNCQHTAWNTIGLGTQQVEEEVQRLFPHLRTLRLDQDVASQILTHSEVLDRFRKREADVLIGTQMVAKGHDFPNVTLVGILDADRSLYFPDFRAGERAFQLFTQAAGRAGRAERPGRVYLQTFHTQEPIFLQAMRQDYDAFVEQELRFRHAQNDPPFGAHLTLTLSGFSEEEVRNTAHMLQYDLQKRFAGTFEGAWLPVLPCPLARINRRYQFQLAIHANGIAPLVRITQFVARIRFDSSIRLQWMLDPA